MPKTSIHILYVFLVLLPLCLTAQNRYKKQVDSLLLVEAKTKQDTARAAVQSRIAQYYAYDRDTINAFKYAGKALALSQKHKYKNGIIDAYLSYAEAYGLANIMEKERDYLNKVISLCTDKSSTSRKIKALERLGINVAYTQELNKGVAYMSQAANLAKETGNDKMYSEIIFQIGGAYHKKGKLYNAAGYYQKVIAFNEKRDILTMAAAAIYLGSIYRAQENDTKALELYLRALKILEERKIQSNFVASLSNYIGDIYADRKEYKKALDYYRKSEEMLPLNSPPDDLVRNYLKLSNLYRKTGNEKLSDNYFNKAAALKTENTFVAYYIKRSLGENRFEAEKYNDALKYHLEAFDLIAKTKTNVPEEIGIAACNIGATRFKIAKAGNDKGRMLDQAIEGLEYGLGILKGANSLTGLYGFTDYLADAYEFKGDSKKALQAYKNFIAYRDSVHEKNKWNEFTAQQSKYEFDKEQGLLKAQQKIALEKEKVTRNYAYAGIGIFVLISLGAGVAYSRKRKDNRIIAAEKKRSDDLLLNILPQEVAEELKEKGEANAKYYDHVSILFTDFVGFTKLSEKFSPEELIGELNYCFKAFDEIITKHNIEKIKTIGDSYMAVSGLPAGNANHARNAVNAAIEMRNFIENYKTERSAQGRVYFEMRTGINSGQVVAGIVGIKKFAYDVWGDAVNIASRMESNGVGGKINISQSTYELVKDDYDAEYRGEIEAKGKGHIKMYFVEPKTN